MRRPRRAEPLRDGQIHFPSISKDEWRAYVEATASTRIMKKIWEEARRVLRERPWKP